MRRLHVSLVSAAVVVLLFGMILVPMATADDHGCYGGDIRCSDWFWGNGTCGYNVSRNGCTCAGELYGGGTWEVGTYDCQIPRAD